MKYSAINIALLAMFAFSLILANSASAQRGELVAGGNLSFGFPQGPFQDQLDEVGIGFNGLVGYVLPRSPIMIGLDFGFNIFAVDRRSEPLSSTIPDLRVNIENSYNMLTTMFLIRASGNSHVFRPYVDALVGFNYLFTETTVRSRSTQIEFASDTNFDDITFAYGIGAGMMYSVYKIDDTNVFLNIQTRYILGGRADYLKRGSITTNNGEVFYDVSNSRTDMLYFQIGIVATF